MNILSLTASVSASVVSQISDGQIQAPATTAGSSYDVKSKVQVTSTVYTTRAVTVSSCAPSVNDCPYASSTPAVSVPASSPISIPEVPTPSSISIPAIPFPANTSVIIPPAPATTTAEVSTVAPPTTVVVPPDSATSAETVPAVVTSATAATSVANNVTATAAPTPFQFAGGAGSLRVGLMAVGAGLLAALIL
ncbi:hypothetical protein ACMFMF_000277 [Clarireedia jacksonii]